MPTCIRFDCTGHIQIQRSRAIFVCFLKAVNLPELHPYIVALLSVWAFDGRSWFGMLCMHQTPMGGAFHDHRYLIPVFPMLAVMLADRLDGLAPRYRGRGRAAVVILIAASSLGVWSHIVAAREQPAFTGRVAWIVLALIGAGIGYWMQRRVTAPSDAARPG